MGSGLGSQVPIPNPKDPGALIPGTVSDRSEASGQESQALPPPFPSLPFPG